MLGNLAKRFFGSANERFVKRYESKVDAINAAEDELKALTDDDLRARTDWLKQRHADGESLDDLLVDAFATVREAARRTLGERPYDVQLIGGIVLHNGMIAEMKTGEGKTLVATLPVYLNSLGSKGVHVVTVNDYLAKRDSEWMGEVYRFLGLTVGAIVHDMDDDERREAYACDVTYGTNNEFGFDYLRDNMKFELEEMVQRPFNYAIVDEVDSILIDEARTPLIISGPAEDSSELYTAVDKLMPKLVPDDYEKDEKQKTVALTDAGMEHIEQLLREAGLLVEGNMYDIQHIALVHHVNQALRAHTMFARDTDYIVKNNQVIIIDEFTGRTMEGRRYSEGLHQALEAKERVEIQMENQTLASITFQNYFRMYPKLAGMTGTAMTEAAEFHDIYKLEVVEIPTNLPMVRDDQDDEVYRTGEERDEAVIDLIAECSKRQQPVLVGTVSIEKSEFLAEKLKQRKVPHEVLNARHHEREAHIIAQAGAPGAVTIATNMAGRGTDIKLGGNAEMRIEDELGDMPAGPEREAKEKKIHEEIEVAKQAVLAAGGLFVIGTERHESRRVDNQLRGRSGRQGDAGASRFFISLQDDLMRIFGSDRMDGWLQKLGLKEGEAVVHSWINKAIERAQRKVEERNFEIRKNLLKFDDVMNDQRKIIYGQRRDIMDREDVSSMIQEMREQSIEAVVQDCIPEGAYPEQWDTEGLHTRTLRPARHRAAGQGLGRRGRHRRPGALRPHPQGSGQDDGREGRQVRPRADAAGGEERAAPDPGPAVEGAPAPARPPAPDRQPARLRPEGPADRVQARGLRHVPGHARRPARDGDRRARPYRDRARRRPRRADAPQRAGDVRVAHGPVVDRAGRRALRRLWRRRHRPGPGAHPPGLGQRRPQRSVDLGQGAAQRGLPVRLGQEVQALPRQGVSPAAFPGQPLHEQERPRYGR